MSPIPSSLEAFHQYLLSAATNYNTPILRSSLHFSSASSSPTPTVTAILTVNPSLCNSRHTLHGGAIATIFDLVTTLAICLVSKPGFWEIHGVTRNLNVVYLEAVPDGEELEVVGEVVKIGKRLVQLKGVMRRRRDGVVVATCEHGKVNVDKGVGGKL